MTIIRAGVRAPLFGDAPLAVGDRVPEFLLPDLDGVGKLLCVEATGVPLIVVLARDLSGSSVRDQIAALDASIAGGKVRARATVRDTLVAEAEMKFMLVDAPSNVEFREL